MATSSAARLEEVRKLEQQLCQNCRKVQLDDTSHEFLREYGEPVIDEGPPYRAHRAEIRTEYSLTDDFPRLPKLEVSSQQGCGFCGYLRELMSCRHTTEFVENHYGINARDSQCPDIEVTIGIHWMMIDPSIDRTYLCATIFFSASDRRSCFEIRSNVTAATGSEDLEIWLPIQAAPNSSPWCPYDIDEMKSKIHECKDEHSHGLPSPNYAPERLLDVREDHPKLVSCRKQLPEAQAQTPRYAALSYCWGTAEEAAHQLTTTRETMSKRQTGIQYDEMPPVLRDAVRVTKSLDIPFLWIDALCILQDDNSDWERQCAQMDGIYGHAEVTLVASSSNSCRESFLQPESPKTLLPFSSQRRPLLGGLLQLRFLECTPSSSVKYYSDMINSRLGTRGWAVQERILSTRMIIFGRTSVHFACPSYSSLTGFRDREYWISAARKPPWPPNAIPHDHWNEVLNQYQTITAKSFTQPTDFLPALSGLASYFGSWTKDRYCAGHWHKDLYRSLMWCSDKTPGLKDSKTHHVSRACSPSPYIVPSWSRLGKGDSFALDEILCGKKQETLKLDAHISQSGKNPFGAILDAQLEVRSYTMCLLTAKNVELIEVLPLYPRGQSNDPDRWELKILQRDETVSSCCVILDYDLKEDDFRRNAEEWKWVLLGISRGRPFGLLVSSANDSKWCRVGVFFFFREDGTCDFTKFSSVETIMII